MLNFNNCCKCNHKWLARVENPVQCPKCKSNLWNIARKTQENEQIAENREERENFPPLLSLTPYDSIEEKIIIKDHDNQVKGGTNGMADTIKLTKPIPIGDEETEQQDSTKSAGEFKLTKPEEA